MASSQAATSAQAGPATSAETRRRVAVVVAIVFIDLLGFGIIILAVLSPAIIDNIGSQMGFGFSDCVKPF